MPGWHFAEPWESVVGAPGHKQGQAAAQVP